MSEVNENVKPTQKTLRLELQPGKKSTVRVEPHARYEVVEASTGQKPLQLKARRVGDDLELTTDETPQPGTEAAATQPQAVLEGYYSQTDVQLVGGTGEAAFSYGLGEEVSTTAFTIVAEAQTSGAALAVLPVLSPFTMALAGGAGLAVVAGGGGGGTPNKLPVATFTQAQEAKQTDAPLKGQLTATDEDKGAVLTYSLEGSAIKGLTIAADGSWTFDPSAYKSLAANETQTIKVTYKVTDERGGSDTESFTINVTGTNDVPVVTSVLTSNAKEGDAHYSLDLLAGTKDADVTDTLSVTGLTYKVDGNATGNGGADLPAGLTLDGNTLKVDPTDDAFNHLGAGQTQVIKVNFTVSDGHGGTVQQTETITITGTNDAAVFAGTSTGTVTEDPSTTGTIGLNASGHLTVADVDTGEAQFRAVDPAALVGKYGTFAFDKNSGDWSYAADNDKLQSLSKAEEATEKLTVSSADGTSKDIVVTLNGVNDAPVAEAATKIGREGQFLYGTVKATDVDAADKLTYSLVGDVPAGLTFNPNGSYSFDAADSAYNSLAEGQTQNVVITFKANDGTTDSNTQTLTITLTGVNDAPVGQNVSQAVTEGQTVTGNVLATDADAGSTLTYALVGSVPAGLTFNTDGSYSFDANNGAYDHLAAGEKAYLHALYKASDGLIDSSWSALDLTVTGVNDAPVFSKVGSDSDAATALEDPVVAVTASGQLTVSDVDTSVYLLKYAVSSVNVVADTTHYTPLDLGPNADAQANQNTLDGLLKMLTVDSFTTTGGKLNWHFNSGDAAALDMVPEGEVMKLEYTLTADDQNGGRTTQVVTIEITGTNDAPKVELRAGDSDTGMVTDWNTDVTGSLTVIDEDRVLSGFQGVAFDNQDIPNNAANSDLIVSLENLLVYAETSTFQTKNESGNYDRVFLSKDAQTLGLSNANLVTAGPHTLTYHMAFVDAHNAVGTHDIAIHFMV